MTVMRNENPLEWTPDAEARLRRVPTGAMREMTRTRVEWLARQRGQSTVTGALVEAKYQQWLEGSTKAASEMAWTDDARDRMARVPPFVRGMVEMAIEAYARSRNVATVTPEIIDEARRIWGETGQFHLS